jgi:DNA-directed RNA polymerase specialized sigma24 family protein
LNDDQQHSRSLQDAQNALNSLTKADWHRLEKAAAYQVFCSPQVSGFDLLQEAVDRVLQGKRNWKTGIPFTTFFYNVMRSIADEWRDNEDRRIDTIEADFSSGADGEPRDIGEFERSGHGDPARTLQIADMLNCIERDFVETEADLSFLLGLGTGKTAEETQAEFCLTPQEYGATRKRWERWLAKHYPGGLDL